MPLAEPDARLQLRKRGDIRQRPPQHRLQDDADVVVSLLAQLAVETQRVVRSVDESSMSIRTKFPREAASSTTVRRLSRQRS
jgi:hypothetical protein